MDTNADTCKATASEISAESEQNKATESPPRTLCTQVDFNDLVEDMRAATNRADEDVNSNLGDLLNECGSRLALCDEL
ncbi:MAG: hypothetical protein MHM6MM_000701 [Cercozoa sp. M6MM]